MHRSRRWSIILLLIAISFLMWSPSARADIKPGVRVGGYFDAGSAFVGGEVLVPVTESWYFNPNLEYVFLDRGSEWTFNFDVHYDFDTDSRWYVWAGAGPAIIFVDPDNPLRDNQTDFGVNLFAGFGYPLRGGLIPYVQPKVILSDNSEFSLAFGLRF